MAPNEEQREWYAMGSGAAGYAWKAEDKVAAYLDDQERPEQAAEIRAAHDCMLDQLGLERDRAFSFLDLGAGAGAVAISVMERFPYASGVLADMSLPMMQSGESRLAPFAGRYRYIEYDMNAEWPPELAGPFQAVVSARAIHHLPDPGKGEVFARIYRALAPGGTFVNWDLFRPTEEPQKPSHPVATIGAQVELMKQAGFSSVSVLHEVGRRRVFLGRKG